jgi:DeoR/GlpR family transcriptional regulator of sugar metabolism
LLAETRRSEIFELLRARGSISVAEVQEQLGVSQMTARRDLAELARRGVAVRTHGGAVLPSISAHEDCFFTRLEEETDAKLALAAAAVELLRPRDSVFLDSSTTSDFVAKAIVELGLELTLVTNSLVIMGLVAGQGTSHVDLIGVGGLLRQLTQSFVGPDAVRTISGHFCDHASLSVKALAPSGVLADADPLEAEVKRAMITQARERVLLVAASKLSARGLNAIGPLSEISLVLAHGVSDADLKPLRGFEVPVRVLGAVDAPAT